MDGETATATVTGCAQIFDLHALKDFAPISLLTSYQYVLTVPAAWLVSASPM